MYIKSLFLLFIFNLSLFAHGVFYDVKEGAISVRVSSANNLAVSDAKIKVFAPGGNLAFSRGFTDINGNFAFVPDSKGKWLVEISVPSDHGNHKKEFYIDIDDDKKVIDFDKMPIERYLGILSILGIIFGVSGLLSFYFISKRKKVSEE